MPFDAVTIAASKGCADRDRSRPAQAAAPAGRICASDQGAQALARLIALSPEEKAEASRKRVQRARDAQAGLVRVELRVPRAMAPAIRFVGAVLAGSPKLGSHERRRALRLRLLRMLAILNSETPGRAGVSPPDVPATKGGR